MSRSDHDVSDGCLTCRGWSCLQCAWAIAHDTCQLDCPDCDDYRVLPEEPWSEPSTTPQADDNGPTGASTRVRRAQRARGGDRGRVHGDSESVRRGMGLRVVLG